MGTNTAYTANKLIVKSSYLERFKYFHLKLCPPGVGGGTKNNSRHLSKLNLAIYNETENSNTRGETLTSTLQRGNREQRRADLEPSRSDLCSLCADTARF